MVKSKALLWALVVCLFLSLGVALWGVSWRGKAQVQTEVIKGLGARLEALEMAQARLRKQAALDRQQAQARAKAHADQASAFAAVKEKLNATPAVVLSGTDADSLREYTEALNAGIRDSSRMP